MKEGGSLSSNGGYAASGAYILRKVGGGGGVNGVYYSVSLVGHMSRMSGFV